MNVPYLLKILDTQALPELVANIDLPALDMNLAVWDAIDRKEVEVNEEEPITIGENEYTGTIRLLVEPEASSDPELKNKILRTIQHYAKNKTNITRGRLNGTVKDPTSGQGYPWHEYIMAVQHLIDDGIVVQDEVDVPAKVKNFTDKKGRKKQKLLRPAHKFAFLGLAENAEENAEWNAEAVNKWIAQVDEQMLK